MSTLYRDKISVYDKHPRAGCTTQMTSTQEMFIIQYPVNTTNNKKLLSLVILGRATVQVKNKEPRGDIHQC